MVGRWVATEFVTRLRSLGFEVMDVPLEGMLAPDADLAGWYNGGEDLLRVECFPAQTFVSTFNSAHCYISALRPNDLILAFSPTADDGRGALVPRKVTRLYRNTTTEWLRLIWEEDGAAKELVSTPGHQFPRPAWAVHANRPNA